MYLLHQSPEYRIRSRLEEMLEVAEKSGREGELTELAAAKGISGYFQDPAVLVKPVSRTVSQGEILQAVSMARRAFQSLKLDMDRFALSPGPEEDLYQIEMILTVSGIPTSTGQRIRDVYSVQAKIRYDKEKKNYLIEEVSLENLLTH